MWTRCRRRICLERWSNVLLQKKFIKIKSESLVVAERGNDDSEIIGFLLGVDDNPEYIFPHVI